MRRFASLGRAACVGLSLLSMPASAGTFVYVSAAEDGNLGGPGTGATGAALRSPGQSSTRNRLRAPLRASMVYWIRELGFERAAA
jgi:hypothetical protein